MQPSISRMCYYTAYIQCPPLSLYIYTHYTQNVNTVRIHSDGLSVLLLLERQQLIIQLTIKYDCDSLPEARVSKLMIKN